MDFSKLLQVVKNFCLEFYQPSAFFDIKDDKTREEKLKKIQYFIDCASQQMEVILEEQDLVLVEGIDVVNRSQRLRSQILQLQLMLNYLQFIERKLGQEKVNWGTLYAISPEQFLRSFDFAAIIPEIFNEENIKNNDAIAILVGTGGDNESQEYPDFLKNAAGEGKKIAIYNIDNFFANTEVFVNAPNVTIQRYKVHLPGSALGLEPLAIPDNYETIKNYFFEYIDAFLRSDQNKKIVFSSHTSPHMLRLFYDIGVKYNQHIGNRISIICAYFDECQAFVCGPEIFTCEKDELELMISKTLDKITYQPYDDKGKKLPMPDDVLQIPPRVVAREDGAVVVGVVFPVYRAIKSLEGLHVQQRLQESNSGSPSTKPAPR